MTCSRPQARSEATPSLDGQGWLMRLRRALLRPRRRMLSPDDLSPHLLRDIGLEDGFTGCHAVPARRWR
jgi:hypothetical protein